MHQRIGSALVRIMACHLYGAKPLSKPVLGYCKLTLRNKLQWNFNQNTKLFIQENASENIVCEMAAIFSRGRWVNSPCCMLLYITHWGRVTHISVSNLIIIGSDNGLSSDGRQAIIWTNAGLLSIGHLGTNFSEISREIHTFSFKKMHLKMPSWKCRPFCLCLNVLTDHAITGSDETWSEYQQHWPHSGRVLAFDNNFTAIR